MLNVILGSAVGGLVAGGLALGAASVANHPPDAPATAASAAPIAVSARSLDVPTEQPTTIECGFDERAELRRGWIAGREVAHVACVPDAAMLRAQPDIVAASPVMTRFASVRPAVASERIVVRDAPRRRSSDRSWTKSTLIIGGSAGAGAGVGGLVGGKKGALIGAALGGGSAAIYEARKRSQ